MDGLTESEMSILNEIFRDSLISTNNKSVFSYKTESVFNEIKNLHNKGYITLPQNFLDITFEEFVNKPEEEFTFVYNDKTIALYEEYKKQHPDLIK